jgi:hypothetical protein
MNNLKLFLLVVWISIVVSFEVNEEMRKHLYDACEAANEYIQKNGNLKESQPTYPQISMPLSPVISPTAFFVLPFLLFDPMNQFPYLFNSEESKLLCPLCDRAGLRQGIVDSNQW